MLDLTRFRLMRREAHGRSRSLAYITVGDSGSATWVHSHFSNDTLRFQEDHLFSRTGQAFFFLLLRFFPFFPPLFRFFFFNTTAYFAQFAIRGYAPGTSDRLLVSRPFRNEPVHAEHLITVKSYRFLESVCVWERERLREWWVTQESSQGQCFSYRRLFASPDASSLIWTQVERFGRFFPSAISMRLLRLEPPKSKSKAGHSYS